MGQLIGLYEQLGIVFVTQSGSERQARCPFHNDTTASLSVNSESGLFKCFAASCKKSGNFERFQKYMEDLGQGDKLVPPSEVDRHHEALLADKEALKWLYEARGLMQETIISRKLGFEKGDPNRIWIPIIEEPHIHNVRRHSMVKTQKAGKTLSYKVGFGKVRLWPMESFRKMEIWLCEGELDCLLMLQAGFNAVTTTGGAGTWKPEWNPYFAGKKVRIVYDTDESGLAGARHIAETLLPVVREIKMLVLPVTHPHKDITDLFVAEGKGREELVDLELKCEPLGKPAQVDDKVYEMPFHQASQQEMVGKRVRVKVTVAGKDLAPFSAPKDINFTCKMGLRICSGCSIGQGQGKMSVTLDASDPRILKLIDTPEETLKLCVRPMVGIVKTCPRFEMKTVTYQNLEAVKLLPEIDFTIDSHQEYVIRQAYFVGNGVRTNQSYEAEGIVTPHPQSQYVTFLFPKLKATKSSIETYKPTKESIDRLAIFQARNSPLERWKDIAADLTSNITRIYQREDLIYATDLVLHSVLSFPFQDRGVGRGWVEGLIVGDTRCGKSETVKSLVQHYRMGEIVTGENVSYAGLVGGLQQTQKRWSITWGKLPLNDRRAVVIDEVSGMSIDDIGRLSGIRSSGIAEISKIQNERTLSRARLLWVSNPRSARPLNTYDSGAEVIKELIGRPEDIARFDFAMLVSTHEVPTTVINSTSHEIVDHKFTSPLCHELLLWIWSRATNNVVYTEQAVKACLDYASDFAKEYSSSLPLVEPNEQRIKFARLGAALAARLFSTEDGENLLVKDEHINLIAKLLNKWYTNTNFNYQRFSEVKRKELSLHPEDEKLVKNAIVPFGIRFVHSLLDQKNLRPGDIEDLTGRDKKDCKAILSMLVQVGALKRRSVGYTKTPAFINLLRGISPEDIPKTEVPAF